MKGEGEGGRTRDSASGDVKSFPGSLVEMCRRGCGEGSDGRRKRISYLSAMALRMHDPRQPGGVLTCVGKNSEALLKSSFLDAGWHVFRV